MAIDRCRVVLIRPHYAGNLGSVARAMANFGLRDLVLVEPIANRQSMEAVMMATRGLDILTGARVVATIAEAVADCGLVIATSGETGGLMRKGFWGTPEEKVPAVLDALDQAPAALLFGPEPHGMTLDELGHAHGMIYIPADPKYASLNLAQAVAVCLYELRRQWLKRGVQKKNPEVPAEYADVERMFEHLRAALVSQRFLWDLRADGIFHLLRAVIARGLPTRKELQVFHGLATQLQFIADTYHVPHPADVPRTRLRPSPPAPPTPPDETGPGNSSSATDPTTEARE
jgi:tRNA/rRNA methyltransferase